MDMKVAGQIVFEVMGKRRSVREYLPEPLDPIALVRMASAGALAPSAGNGQPCRFLVIDDRKKIDALLDCSLDVNDERRDDENERSWSNQYRTASAVIIVLEDMNSPHPEYAAHDCPLAAANIMLAATAMGYGSTYVTDTISPAGARRALNLPERYVPYCATILGIPAKIPQKPPKRGIAEIVWRNSIDVPFELEQGSQWTWRHRGT
jgi:nitroreductase